MLGFCGASFCSFLGTERKVSGFRAEALNPKPETLNLNPKP